MRRGMKPLTCFGFSVVASLCLISMTWRNYPMHNYCNPGLFVETLDCASGRHTGRGSATVLLFVVLTRLAHIISVFLENIWYPT